MQINPVNVGGQILSLRKNKGLTQSELGEKLNISFQAVSKWERGETLPDTAILPGLAGVLETTVDNILTGGEKTIRFKGRLSAKDMREGIDCIERIGFLLGKQNFIYRYIIEGLSEKMNTDVESMLSDEYLRECLICEPIIHNMKMGYYFDISDIRNNFKYKKWVNTLLEYAEKYGII